jgi:hypothetical protein
MKTIALTLLLAMLIACTTRRLETDTNHVAAAYELVLVQILKEATPHSLFSIALLVNHKERTLIPFAPAAESRILRAAAVDTALFVRPADVRLPEDQETRPGDPTGKQMRGVESQATGDDVWLYSISGVRMTSPDTLEVYYSIYSGPLAARGGSYKLHIGPDGIRILESLSGWES